MPIYAYRCDSCGHQKDVLQKMSDAPLTDCPQCGKASFAKQLTAAGFQLKGSGWYATDFRGGGSSSTASSTTTSSSTSESSAAASDSGAACGGGGCACH
ncbi:FmdB family zinc ribbon protein [Leeia aquatica]|uniref:Zinc ribbon domain-containing protein n=1 Tax=Leeia aquatica TaxID=2725557 RepID=A0A847S6P4_9NEIS|nr:FmdB family zinc ribbon protein [Leeia aquatica]NLR75554.1 zinc ribbon domain-containing protein [Leeia aquatica]